MITPSVWDSFNLILQINFKESLQLMMFYTKGFNCYIDKNYDLWCKTGLLVKKIEIGFCSILY